MRLSQSVRFILELFDLQSGSNSSLMLSLIFLGFNSCSLGISLLLLSLYSSGCVIVSFSISSTASSREPLGLFVMPLYSPLRLFCLFEEFLRTELFSMTCSLSSFQCLIVKCYEFISSLLGGDCIFCRLFLESRNRVLICVGSQNLSCVLFSFCGSIFGVFLLLGIGNALAFGIEPLFVSGACCLQLFELLVVQFFELSNVVVVGLSTCIRSCCEFFDPLLCFCKSLLVSAALLGKDFKLLLGLFSIPFMRSSQLPQVYLMIVCILHVVGILFD